MSKKTRCAMCGAVVPEGRQVCWSCKHGAESIVRVPIQSMSLNDYQRLAKRTFRGKNACIENAVLGLVGEAGEIADYIKKVKFQGHEYSAERVRDELGDLLFYLANMAHLCGFSLQEVAEYNDTKLWERYPNGFEEQMSINRR